MKKSFDYKDLVLATRFRPTKVQDRDVLMESESDRGRLIYCAAFRRLQQKAQVFSMESNAAVRSRLTHSLEVSQIGRYISDLVTKKLIEDKNIDSNLGIAIVNFVETACLMHDIGNPPFGHFGEAAIQKWFEENGCDLAKKACSVDNESLVKRYIGDFIHFDGNPQGLRIVTSLQRNDDEFGLNLTTTTLATYLKYIKSGDIDFPLKGEKHNKKCGFFLTEAESIMKIWGTFNYLESPQRFPLAYIMEAADDIAYCISDLEDSGEKGLISVKDALTEIHRSWGEIKFKSDCDKNSADEIGLILERGIEKTFIDFRTALTRFLVDYAAKQYISNHVDVLSGKLDTLIPEKSPAGTILESLKEYCRKNVYIHESVQRIELAGYSAISGLLDHFKILLTCNRSRFKSALNQEKKDESGSPIVLERKFLALFPPKYIQAYKERESKLAFKSESDFLQEWNLRAHLITDFISGMTDDFAMKTFRELSGMQL